MGQREGNSPVFREAYNAQLREVHGANVRAVEAQAEEEEEEDGMRRKRKKALDPEAVNSLVEDVIRDIAAEGELVTREKVTIFPSSPYLPVIITHTKQYNLFSSGTIWWTLWDLLLSLQPLSLLLNLGPRGPFSSLTFVVFLGWF